MKAPPRAGDDRLLAAHDRCCDWFARMLGLERLAPSVRVTTVTVGDRDIRLDLDTGEAPVTIVLEPPSDRGAFLRTPTIHLSYLGQQLPADIKALLERTLSSLVGRLEFDRLHAMATRGSVPRSPQGPANPGESVKPLGPGQDTAGAGSVDADFFGVESYGSFGMLTSDFPHLFQVVLHCDNECSQHGPDSFAGPAPAVERPYRQEIRAAVLPLAMPQSSGISEHDVIMGNRAGLQQAVDTAATLADVDRRPVLVCTTCVPSVAGEDVESIARRARVDPSAHAYVMGPGADAVARLLRRVLTDRRDARVPGAPRAAARSLNLVGFPDDRTTHELRAHLESLGIATASVVVPNMDWERVDAMPSAEASIYAENRWWQSLYQVFVDVMPGRHLALPTPFGWAGTREWLRRVVQHLEPAGCAASVDLLPGAALEQAWQHEARRSQGKALGFVVDARSVACLIEPAMAWGVPLVDVACEAGFQVEIWHPRAVRPDDLAPLLQRLRERSGLEPPRLIAFETLRELEQGLAASKASAFFSQYQLDRRLTSAGKSRFSFSAFELGFEGAVRTVRTLNGLADRTFFAGYGRYVGRPQAPEASP